MNKGLMKGLITAGFLFIITFAAILSINYIIPAFAATLSSTNVQPLSLFAGTNGTIDVNFTTVSSIPADGIIKITLPSSFSVGGLAWCNLTGSFTSVITGNTTTITRSGGTATDAVTPVWCTINNTINPRVSGSTGNYIIRTTDAGETPIDNDNAVGADTITAGNLTTVNVQPLNPAAGANTTVDVNFTTANEIPANGRIAVTFGSGFALGGSFGWCNVSGSFASSVSGQKIIITRSGGDATLNVTPVWCTVNATINPRTSGSTGIYTVNTTTNANVLIDTLDVAADTLVGGNLTSANVQPASLNANANTSVDVNFTTANEIPANGKINVAFGSGFSVGGLASCNLTGTYTTAISNQVLTITRSADGGATFNVTPISCVINNTRNPTTTGSTGIYTVNTTTSSNVLIDTLTVAADTVVQGYGGALSSTNVQPLSLQAGANGTVDVNFTLANPIPNNASINVTFGSGFSVGGRASCDITGTFNTTITGQTVVIRRNADGSETAANTAISCKINNTKNANITGSTGTYTIATSSISDSFNLTIDSLTNVDLDTITAGNLTSVNVQPLSLVAGANTTVDVNFTVANNLPGSGRVSIAFGSGFSVGGPAWCNFTGAQVFNTSISSQSVSIIWSERNTTGTTFWCTVNNTRNPQTTGSTGIYTVNTSNADAVLIDRLDVAADTITAGALTSTNVQPISLAAGANGTVDINFTVANPIPSDGKIVVTFGSGFSVGGNGTCNALDGIFATSISGQVVTLTRSTGTASAANIAVNCTLNNTRNPQTTGSTGTYNITTKTSADAVIDTDAAVAADTVTAGALTSTNVQPLTLNANANTTIDANFTLANPLPANATINVTFGSGFKVGGPASCNVAGTFNTSISGQTVIITRNANGAETAATTAVSCRINNTKNPASTGSTGTYTITTLLSSDSLNQTIDTASVTADTITQGTGGALTSTNVQPLSLVAGANGTVDINFTTTNPIPADGKIKILFPSGFSLQNIDVVSALWCGSMDGSFAVSRSNQLVTLARSGGTEQAGGSAESCKINATVNPRVSGSAGAYRITITDASDALIDNDSSVTADTIVGGNLTSANVQPISLNANANTTVDVNFTTANSIPSDGKITVVFGSGFSVGGPVWCNETGTYTGSYSGTNVTITRSGGSATVNASLVWCTVNNTRNPLSTGTTGIYSINTTTSGNVLIDTLTVAADTVVQGYGGALSSANVQPLSLVAGANTTVSTNVTVDANFTLANPLPANATINVTFGSGFSVGGPTSCDVTGTFNTSISGQTVIITRNADGSETAAATAVSCRINNTKNPATTGSTGTYTITTLLSSDSLNKTIDTLTTVTLDTITAGALTSTNVQPISLAAGANGTVDINFTVANPIPSDGKIVVTFGSGFSVGGNGTCNALDGIFATSISGQVVTLTRSTGTASAANIAVNCTLNNTRNPQTTGTTGTYNITTKTSADAVIDTDAAVGADTITAGALSSTNVQPISLVAGANTTVSSNVSVDINFTVANPIPSDGKIVVTFGSGFSVGGPGTCNALDGIFATSISGQVVTLTRSTGTASAANIAVNCTLNNTRNPQTTGSTGTYNITTKNSTNAVIDTDASIGADTITAGALTLTNVQPLSLVAGANTTVLSNITVDANFTLANPLPANATINVTFGSGFSVGGPGTCNSMDGTFNTTISGQTVILTRNADGTEQAAGSAESCKINATKNPATTGSTGTYTITTLLSSTSLNQTIDTLTTVTLDTITAGNLTSVEIQPLSLVAGANTTVLSNITVDVNFTLANPWPAGGIVSVTFGSGFKVGGPASCNVSGTFNTTIAGQRVIVTRNADGSQIGASNPVSCRINNTKNPATTGSTDIYTVNTSTNADVLIDTLDVAADIITAGALSSTNVQPISLVAGANTSVSSNVSVDINFTVANPIPSDGKIVVTFGSGFSVGGPGTCNALDGIFATSISGQVVTLTRSTGTASAANIAVNCTLNNTRNPQTTGTTGTYNITTKTSADAVIDTDAAVAADTIIQGYGGALVSTNVQPISLVAGANTTIDVNFTLANALPANATINVTFGSGFSVGGPASCNVTGTFNTSIAGQTAIITRNANGAETATSTPVSCRINNTKNPVTTGTTGTYTITTLLSSDSLNQTIDTLTTVTADTIVAGNLTSVNVQPLNLATGANTTVDVNFTLANPLPAGGRVSVLFGGSFNVSGVQGASCNVSGTFNTTTALQRVIITRNADGVQWNASAPVSCKVNNTVNPLLTGSTGIYTVNTSTSADVLIDTLDVAADTITQGTGGTLTSTNIQPLSLVAGTNTTIDVNFTSVNPIPANATINITFPSGFTLGGVVTTAALWCGSMDGTFNVSVSGQTVILTRNADGTAQAGNSAESCKINGTINPTAAVSTGTYTIKTIISDILIDNATVAADTITATTAAKLKIYVASSVLTNESATVTVWAQDTYGNNATSSAWVTVGANGSARLTGPGLYHLISGQTTMNIQDSVAEIATINATEYTTGAETLNSTTTAVTFTLADIVAPSISGTSPTTADSITSNSVAMYVNTTESATCKFDNSDVSYAAMANTMTGASTTHNFTLSSLSNGAKTYFARCQDTAGNTMTISTAISFTVSLDVTPSIVIAVGPSGTIANSRPELLVNTSESATCKFDNSTKAYSSMTYTMTGTGATHNFTLWSLLDSDKTFAVRCQDTTGNAMNVSESITFTVDTRTNFNLTIPRGFGSNGYFTFRNNNNGWNSFQLVQNMDLNNTGLANYNVTNVLASVAGNYSKIYSNEGGTWKVYVPGTAGNTFTVFSSNATGENYYINMTIANERIEIN